MKNRNVIERKIIALIKYAERNKRIFYETFDKVEYFNHKKRLHRSINKISIMFMNDYFYAVDTTLPRFMYPSLSRIGYLSRITETNIIHLLFDYIENYQMNNLIEIMSERQKMIYNEWSEYWKLIRIDFCHFPEIREKLNRTNIDCDYDIPF